MENSCTYNEIWSSKLLFLNTSGPGAWLNPSLTSNQILRFFEAMLHWLQLKLIFGSSTKKNRPSTT